MTTLAAHLSAFLREHLPRERRASPHTCEAYAYAFQLLVCFAARRLGARPDPLEHARHGATTRSSSVIAASTVARSSSSSRWASPRASHRSPA